jgi:hypothetical protein
VISGAGAAGINLLAMMAHLRVSPRHIIEWVLPAAGITGLLALSLIVCSVLIGDRVGSPALRLAIMASIAFVNVVVGFRLLMSRNKRQMLSNYVFLGTSPPAMSIARIFGFPAGSA